MILNFSICTNGSFVCELLQNCTYSEACPNNMIFSEHSSQCDKTCSSMMSCVYRSKPGCTCPEGLLLNVSLDLICDHEGIRAQFHRAAKHRNLLSMKCLFMIKTGLPTKFQFVAYCLLLVFSCCLLVFFPRL